MAMFYSSYADHAGGYVIIMKKIVLYIRYLTIVCHSVTPPHLYASYLTCVQTRILFISYLTASIS